MKKIDYDSFGTIISDTNPTMNIPFGFAGGDTNLYGYVLNDPVNLFDPFGLVWRANKNDPSAMGSEKAWRGFRPGDPAMRFFELYVPNFYETSKRHDAMLDFLGIENPWGDFDSIKVNILTMPIAFDAALLTNIYQSITTMFTNFYHQTLLSIAVGAMRMAYPVPPYCTLR